MNAVFIHIPKTGGLTVVQMLGVMPFGTRSRIRRGFTEGEHQIVSFVHLNYSDLVKHGYVTEGFDRSSFKFCFCRNPYDRVVSHWSYARHKHPELVPPGTSFLEFTRTQMNGDRFRPQSWWVAGLQLDFVGRFEQLQEDIARLAKILGVKTGRKVRRNASHHEYFKHYYCLESAANVARRYGEDFERFGYPRHV